MCQTEQFIVKKKMSWVKWIIAIWNNLFIVCFLSIRLFNLLDVFLTQQQQQQVYSVLQQSFIFLFQA